MHVRIDGYQGNPSKLGDPRLLYEFLERYPSQIGMTPISPVQIWHYDGGEKTEDWGYSTFVLIAESHIVIHTFPEYGEGWIDIFTCNEFECDLAEEDIKARFGFEFTEVTIDRERGRIGKHGRSRRLVSIDQRMAVGGNEWPHDVTSAIPLMKAERQQAALLTAR